MPSSSIAMKVLQVGFSCDCFNLQLRFESSGSVKSSVLRWDRVKDSAVVEFFSFSPLAHFTLL